jgi:RimJ/RimL family protein N-acetyltransferase
MTIIKEFDDLIICKIDNLLEINNQSLDKFNLNRSKKLIITFDKEIENENILLNEIPSRYYTKIAYSIKKNLLNNQIFNLPSDISIFSFNTQEEFQRYYYYQFETFYNNWKKYLPENYINVLAQAAKEKEFIDKTKYLCLSKNATIISFTTLIKWYDYNKNPADLVGHIWIDVSLEKEKRNIIRNYFSYWFKKNMNTETLLAGIDVFNIRSQKFFRKMGFKPKWITIKLK